MTSSLLCLKLGHGSKAMEVSFIIGTTLFAFVLGNEAPPTFKALCQPVFLGVLGSWLAMAMWASEDENRSFHDVLVDYSSPSGGGPIISRLLNPFVISLSLVLFDRRHVLQRDSRLIFSLSCIASVSGLLGTAVLARLLHLPRILAESAVSRFTTVALALTMASELHSSPPLIVATVVLTASIGVVISKPLMKYLDIKGSRERGLCVGGVSHVLGTVSLASWDEAAVPYGLVSSVLVSGIAAALAAIPAVDAILLWILPS